MKQRMRSRLSFIQRNVAAAICFSLGMLAAFAGESEAPKPERPGWKLVWSDEFDTDGAPDPKKWGYETGFIRNNELQYYTPDRRENARVENGSLVIEARKEKFPNAQFDPVKKNGRA